MCISKQSNGFKSESCTCSCCNRNAWLLCVWQNVVNYEVSWSMVQRKRFHQHQTRCFYSISQFSFTASKRVLDFFINKGQTGKRSLLNTLFCLKKLKYLIFAFCFCLCCVHFFNFDLMDPMVAGLISGTNPLSFQFILHNTTLTQINKKCLKVRQKLGTRKK